MPLGPMVFMVLWSPSTRSFVRCGLRKNVTIHDCGHMINPMIVEGQVHGGIAQGLGGAMYERLDYDPDGNLTNANFVDFLVPYATEIPDIKVLHLETPSPLNPLE